MVLLKDDKITRRIKTITELTGTMHLYVIHPIFQPKIIEELIISLEYNLVGHNIVEEGTTDSELGKNNVEEATMFENVMDKSVNLNEGTTFVENMVDKEVNLN